MAQPDREKFMEAIMLPSQIYLGTAIVILVNLFILPAPFVVLRRSGDAQRLGM